MATKGKAAKSASGASMSKYDVEVEARLHKLETHTHAGSDSARVAALEAKVDDLIARLSRKITF